MTSFSRWRRQELAIREGAKIISKSEQVPIKKSWLYWKENIDSEKFLSPFGKVQLQLEDLSSETGTTTFNIEPEFSFEESLQPSKRRPEYWDRLGSSKSRTEEQQIESRAIIQGLLDTCSQTSVIAFTDGSCQPNPGPCGAGSCIFMPNQDEPICLKKPVSSHSSILLGELVAILLTIDYVTEEINRTNFTDIHIFSDSQSAIGILKLGWQPTHHKQTVAEIRQKIERLEHNNITVNISWTPGHANIRGNEEADRLAKEASSEAAEMKSETEIVTMADIQQAATDVKASGAADKRGIMPKAAKAKCPGKSQSKKGKAANNAESTPSTSSDMGNKSKASADSLPTETAREKAKSTNENCVSNGDASANVAKDGDTNTRGEKATTCKEGEGTNDSGDASPPKKKRRINSWLNKPHYNEEVKEDEKGNTVTSYDLDDYTSVTEIVTPGGDKSIFRWRNEPQERMEAPNCDDDEILDLKENMKDYPMLKKVTNPVRYEETAIIVYSEDMIKMAKNQPSLSVDRTFHLGPCLVTMMVFRNENLKNRDSTANKKKPPPLFVGPTLLHFDYDEEAYKVFFRHVQKQLQLPVTAPDSPVKGKGKGKRPRKKYRPFPDNHIYNAMESVFGTTLKLCNGHMSPGAIRKQMRDLYFKPWESVTDVVRKWEFYFHECQSMFLSGGLSRELTDEAKLGMRALGWDMEDRELIRNHEKEVYQDFLGLRPRLE